MIEQDPGSRRRFAPACPGRRASRIDFVDQLDQLLPGEGTKAIRGVLHALAATPQLQRAFFGGPVIETAPFGVFEQDGPARYEEAIRTRPWEPQNESSGFVQPMGDRPEYDPVTGKWTLRDPVTGARRPASPHEIMNRPPVMHLGDAIEPAQDEVEVEEAEIEDFEVADDEIENEATATDYADDAPEALLVAQAQPPQPGQQPRPPQNQNRQPQPAPQPARPQNQNRQPQRPQAPAPAQPQRPQNPPRQGQDRIPQPPAQAQPAPQQPQPPAPAQPRQPGANREPRRIPPPDPIPPQEPFRALLATRESRNQLGIQRMKEGADGRMQEVLGLYQLSRDVLVDAGLKNPDGTWREGNAAGVTTDREFLASREAQDIALPLALGAFNRQVRAGGADRAIGQRIAGVREEITVTESGLIAAAHRAGAETVRLYVERMEANGWDSQRAIAGIAQGPGNAEFRRRLEERHKWVETRLREFGPLNLR
jgi:hypothetical protein